MCAQCGSTGTAIPLSRSRRAKLAEALYQLESKSIVFDDFVDLSKKEMKKLFDYAIASRKFGFTCAFISQSYTSVPKIISRNCNYLFIFRLNDK